MSVRLLDSTLRDGGYVNNWEFGKRRINGVISGLTHAGIDIVECGFLQNKPHTKEQSLYNSISEVASYLPEDPKQTKYVIMLNSGDYEVNKLHKEEADLIFGIRIVFHIHQMDTALKECKIIKEKGYRAFLQPMGTDCYTDKSLLELIEKANEIEPYAFYFVDSLGVMSGDDIVRLALLLHNNLKRKIVLGFHSHNNLQLAFSNAQKFINMRLKREIIVDGSIYGMGRGAGNLNTELIANYLNENLGSSYDTDQILRVYDEYIQNLHDEYTWGYSVPYYLAATHKCHPNYGTYMANKVTLPVTDIGVLLSSIPPEYKRVYSEELIEKMYYDYIANKIDDTENYELLSNDLSDKQILLLGPGRTLMTHADIINGFIKDYNPTVISINHEPENYKVDYAFYSNLKRFEGRNVSDVRLILTSNIKHSCNDAISFDYLSLCNQKGKYIDNAALLLLNLLLRLRCNIVSIAGLDGHTGNDYYQADMKHISNREWMNTTNDTIASAIAQISKSIKIDFITPSIYNR